VRGATLATCLNMRRIVRHQVASSVERIEMKLVGGQIGPETEGKCEAECAFTRVFSIARRKNCCDYKTVDLPTELQWQLVVNKRVTSISATRCALRKIWPHFSGNSDHLSMEWPTDGSRQWPRGI